MCLLAWRTQFFLKFKCQCDMTKNMHKHTEKCCVRMFIILSEGVKSASDILILKNAESKREVLLYSVGLFLHATDSHWFRMLFQFLEMLLFIYNRIVCIHKITVKQRTLTALMWRFACVLCPVNSANFGSHGLITNTCTIAKWLVLQSICICQKCLCKKRMILILVFSFFEIITVIFQLCVLAQ